MKVAIVPPIEPLTSSLGPISCTFVHRCGTDIGDMEWKLPKMEIREPTPSQPRLEVF